MMAIHNEVLPNDDVLRYYFYFINERMKIFWRRCEGKATLTDDPILRKYKFTNVYRALDRVSQYLIRYVIYLKSATIIQYTIKGRFMSR